MGYQELAKKLEGFQTVFTIAKTLNIKPRTAINYVNKLRKSGYLQKTSRGHNKIRMYYIKPFKKLQQISYPSIYDIINKYSRVKIATRYNYISHNKISVEEALVKALKSGEFKTMLCALELFNYVNWSKLYKIANREGIARNIGALYDVIRTVIKVKKMDERTRRALLKSNGKKFIIKNFPFKSKDHGDIEKKWRVFVPFNKQDLFAYKEWST